MLRAVAALSTALALCACGSSAGTVAIKSTQSATANATAPAVNASPSPGNVASPSPFTPDVSATCSAAPDAAAAPLVLFPQTAPNGSSELHVEGFADPARPKPLCTLSGRVHDVTFISPTEMGYVTNSSANDPIGGVSSIERLALTGGPPTTVATVQGDVLALAWSADGANVAYVNFVYAPNIGSGDANQLWLKLGDAAPKALTPLMPLFGRSGAVDDEDIVRFSPDGKYLLMLDTYVSGGTPTSGDLAMFQVRSVPTGGRVWVPPIVLTGSGGRVGPYVSWAVWAHLADRLFYRDPAGVHVWDATSSTLSDVAPGLLWQAPSLSSDDTVVAYQVSADDKPHIEVRDLASRVSRTLPGVLGYPLLLSTKMMLEAHMTPNTQMGPPFVSSGEFVLNLTTGAETPAPWPDRPSDTWPR